MQQCSLSRNINLPELQDPLSTRTSPDAEDVLPVTDAHHNTANLLTGLAELVANNGKQQVLPIAVRNALLEAHHPLATRLVLLVLPYWPDSLLEEVVVRYQRQC